QTIWAWSLTIKPGPKFVLLALADYANDEGECYPSLKQLHKKCGLSRSTLITHLSWLKDQKIMLVTRQYDKNGYRRQNLYQLNANLSPNSEPSKVRKLDGNNINSHQYNHKKALGPKFGPLCAAWEGAI
ncbi:MAG: helix-turn-helix domain-containing protein, partial [Gammaproteobacteria bacterium]|nr:helix-turn-helix domain-containing protein [Gammaproteobacteria bacterium]